MRTVIFAVEAFLLTDLMPRVASVYVHAYPRISCKSATHRLSVLRSMTVHHATRIQARAYLRINLPKSRSLTVESSDAALIIAPRSLCRLVIAATTEAVSTCTLT